MQCVAYPCLIFQSDLAESLRIFMDLAENRSYLVITDLANFRYASQTIKDSTKPSESSVNEFLSKFQSGQVIYKYIQNRFIWKTALPTECPLDA